MSLFSPFSLRDLVIGEGGVSRRGRRRRQRLAARRLVPWPEGLESRAVPSTLTVTSPADSGPGSLRDAIAQAKTNDTIKFARPVHVITLTSGELEINKNLSIKGPGTSQLTVSGNNASRVFEIDVSQSVSISGLTIADGAASGLLPILASGSYSAGGGGGVLNNPGASLTLDHVVVRDNQADAVSGYTVVGGGLLNVGTASVQSCQFSNNEVLGGSGTDNIGGSAGAAIDNFGGASLTVTDSTFSNNRAEAAGGGFYFGIGGAVENNAGLNGFAPPPLSNPSTATFTHCTFSSNVATGGAGVLANGGALCNEGIGTVVNLSACIVDGNQAVGGANDVSASFDSQAIGGGLLNGSGTLNVKICLITNNTALGGSDAPISNSDPYASGAFGGGIENNFDGVLNIRDSTISGNVAQGGAMVSRPGPGGVAVGGGISNSPSATMNMQNCVVSSNSAVAGAGNAGVNIDIAPDQQAGFGFGGGIDISNNRSTATIKNSVITCNTAIGGAGGGGNNGNSGLGGGIGVGQSSLLGSGFGPDGSQLNLINSTVSNNGAVGGAGGTGANGGNGFGGGLVITASCNATLSNSVIAQSSALGGTGGSGGTDGPGSGGGTDNSGNLSLSKCSVSQNQSTGGLGGGGVRNEAGASLTVDQSDFSSNTASVNATADVFGGGLLNEGSATVTSSKFSSNSVVGGASFSQIGGSAGGGIDNFHGAILSVSDSTFVNNQAVGAAGPYYGLGGALDNNGGPGGDVPSTATVTNCVFRGNLATVVAKGSGNGGALDNIGAGSSLMIDSCTISDNLSVGGDGGDGETAQSDGLGGGIMNQFGGVLLVTNSMINRNLALAGNNATPTIDNPNTGAGYGGGIFGLISADTTVINSTISNNEARGGTTATGSGGSAIGGGIGLFFQCTLTLIGCTINNNLADAGQGTDGASAVAAGFAAGGGIDVSRFSTATLTNCTINNNTAIGGTGGAGANGGNAYGGGIEVGLNVVLGYADGSSLQINDCTINHNKAKGGQGGAGANGGDALGGGIAVIVDSSANVTASDIEHNDATGGSAGAGGSAGSGIGGGVYNLGTFVYDGSTVIKHNHASTSDDDIFT
jgi:hypothetical protein